MNPSRPRPWQATVPGYPDQLVLVVDDHDSRAMMRRLLNLHGFQALTIPNGLEAVAWLDNATIVPSLIVLDLAMPVMDGRRYLVRRQHRSDWRQIPLIVVSGLHDAADQLRGLDVAAFHTKPVRSTRLLAQIASALGLPLVPQGASAAGAPSSAAAGDVAARTAVDAGAASGTVRDDVSPEPPDATSIPDPSAGT
jgi:CheY-like chemotaxis protein